MPKDAAPRRRKSLAHLMEMASIQRKRASLRRVKRVLNVHGFKYLQAQKKGILTEQDLAKRLLFA